MASRNDEKTFSAHLERARNVVITFGKFIGPGFMVAVAYSKIVISPPRK